MIVWKANWWWIAMYNDICFLYAWSGPKYVEYSPHTLGLDCSKEQCDQVFWNFCSPSRRFLPKNFAQCLKVPKYIHQTNFQTQKYLHQSQFETSKDLHQKEFWNNLCSLKFKKVAVLKISPKIRRFSRRISYLKNSPRPLKSSPNGENSPHLVTLPGK